MGAGHHIEVVSTVGKHAGEEGVERLQRGYACVWGVGEEHRVPNKTSVLSVF